MSNSIKFQLHIVTHCVFFLAWISFCSGNETLQNSERQGIRWGGVPIANYTTDKGLTLGACAQRFNYGDPGKLPFESLFTVQGRYSTQAQNDFLISYETTKAGNGEQRLLLSLYGSRNEYSRYYGLGEGSSFDTKKELDGYFFHLQKEYQANASLRTPFALGFELETGINIRHYFNEANRNSSRYFEDFGTQQDFGTYLLFNIGAVLEKRNYEFIPYKGHYLASSLSVAPGLGTSSAQKSWGRYDLDARRYDTLIDNRWLWFASQFRFTTSSENTPLQEKARLGSFGTLRGLPYNRFIGSYSASVRGELRSIIFRETLFKLPLKGGMGLFLDTGKVFDEFSRVAEAPIQWAWGLSFFGSYFTDDFLGTADIGFSKESTAIYLKIGHAF